MSGAEDGKENRQKNSIKDIEKVFKDPVHGYIELHPLLVKMIDTPEFQRLRHIKQLGTKYLVFPGATHTRFAHSIGVAHLARCLVETLQKNQPELNITERDSLCVQIAALCHDMGHGPFSHLFDGMFIPEVNPDDIWKHEKASVDMFDLMRKKNLLSKVMKDYGLDLDKDTVFIKELILKEDEDEEENKTNKWSMKGRTEDKSFLYEIVSNNVNGIDVDKWDYLTRDCYYLGIPCGFDHKRLLQSLRVCEVNGRKHICFKDKVAENVYGMFHTRYTLHRQVLQHKIGYIIDVKIKDVLVKANNTLHISAAKDNMQEYAKLTDHIFDKILNQTDFKGEENAKQMLKDIVERKLPKFVGEARLNEDGLKEMLKQHWEKTLKNLDERERNLCNDLLRKLEDSPDKEKGKYQKILLDSLEGDVSKIRDTLNGDLKAHPGKAFKIKVYQKILKKYGGFGTLADEDIYDICVLDMGFGEVGKEPIENVHFYSKNDPDKAFKVEKFQVSSLKPKKFHEWLVRVYYKKTSNNEDKQMHQMNLHEAKKSFHVWCTNKKELIDFGTDSDPKGKKRQKEEMKGGEEEDIPEETTSVKVFHDSIYGQIELDHRLVMIIDTPEFQRLRHIKQLGAADWVYPGATHTRFEHSLGMAHLAGLMITFLKENQPDLCIDDKDILCVKIAALCYNLGHGPFSHLYERYCREALEQGESVQDSYCAQKISNQILHDILKNKNLSWEEDLKFIEELIVGVDTGAKPWPAEGRTENKAFLYEIVINKWNGIDVHMWDYFARDCHHLGIPNSFDHMRLLKSARVCEAEGRNHICFRDKVADNVYDMFRTKYRLYSDAYKHKIVCVIDQEFREVLSAAAKKLTKISPLTESSRGSGSRKQKTPATEERTAKVPRLTDHIFEEIMYSTDDDLKDARMKLQGIVIRRLPKCVGETRITEEEHKNKQLFEDKWNKAVDEWNKLQPTVFLDKNDFRIDTIQLDSSNKEAENPLNNVFFYSKRNLNHAFKIKKYEVSSLLPEEFTEYVGRVYYTKNSDKEEQVAKECFKWWRLGMCQIWVYNQEDFRGSHCLITADRPALGRYAVSEIRSCKVVNGVWELCEGQNYDLPTHQVSPGEDYRNPQTWSNNTSTASAKSLRHERE